MRFGYGLASPSLPYGLWTLQSNDHSYLKVYMVEHYNLDMILSVGYRVKSKRGIAFRRWANAILKKYLVDGYAINERRMAALQKTVEIQTKMLADTLNKETRKE